MAEYLAVTTERKEVSWADIQRRIREGEKIKPGTVICDKLKDGREFEVVVTHNDPYHRNEAAFVFKKAPFRKEMNRELTNAGGFKESDLRKELKEFFNLLPDDLQAVIKKKKIIQSVGGTILKCKAKLWPVSEYEMFGESYYGERMETDTVQFDYYKDRKNRMIAIEGEDAYGCIWLATPNASNTTSFCFVSGTGFAHYYSAANTFGVAPGFLIR